MTTKKPFGILFIIISGILFIALIGQFQSIIKVVIGFIKMFSEGLDVVQSSKVVGSIIYWILHILLMDYLWRLGRKWVKNWEVNE